MKENFFRMYNPKTHQMSYFSLTDVMLNSTKPLDGYTKDCVIMSSTDVQDIHGKYIFKNDIVRGSKYGVGYVIYRKDLARYVINFSDDSSDVLSAYQDLEIVGLHDLIKNINTGRALSVGEEDVRPSRDARSLLIPESSGFRLGEYVKDKELAEFLCNTIVNCFKCKKSK